MKNGSLKAFVSRKVQNRRGFDFGPPVDRSENRTVVERRKVHVEAILKPDWLVYKTLLGANERAFDKSFTDVFGSW
jgi:hypothetical protein